MVTFVLLLAVNWVAFFDLQGGSFARKLLDLRVMGYTVPEAEMFARGLSFEEKTAYREVYLILDFVFIGFLCALLYALSQAITSCRIRRGLLVATVVFAAMDLSENTLVPQIIDGDFELAKWASLATQLKFAALGIAAALVVMSWRKGRFE
ncbi:MAG: hypothetical protein AAF340_09930 [Pseudomonadota bacterium]